jgi:hypothetical protein
LSATPASPIAGQPGSILIHTFVADSAKPDGVGARWAVAEYPFRVEAVAPSGAVFAISMARGSDPYIWRGEAIFSETGDWLVWVRNCEYSDRAPWPSTPRCSLHLTVTNGAASAPIVSPLPSVSKPEPLRAAQRLPDYASVLGGVMLLLGGAVGALLLAKTSPSPFPYG